MAVKEQVRERRRNRIREIVSNRRTSWFGSSGKPSGAAPSSREARGGRTGGRAEMRDDRFADPEYAWKHRDNPWQRGGGGDWSDYDRWLTSSIRLQLVLSVLFFALSWMLFAADSRFSWVERGQSLLRTALSEPADFSVVTGWYERRFAGSPSILPSLQSGDVPAERVQAELSGLHPPVRQAELLTSYAETGKGLTLGVPPKSDVAAIDEGRVIFAAQPGGAESGWTVVVQHAGGLQSIYGRLHDVSVEANDWVEPGQRIGAARDASTSSPTISEIYFAMKLGDDYMNPTDVIALD